MAEIYQGHVPSSLVTSLFFHVQYFGFLWHPFSSSTHSVSYFVLICNISQYFF